MALQDGTLEPNLSQANFSILNPQSTSNCVVVANSLILEESYETIKWLMLPK